MKDRVCEFATNSLFSLPLLLLRLLPFLLFLFLLLLLILLSLLWLKKGAKAPFSFCCLCWVLDFYRLSSKASK